MNGSDTKTGLVLENLNNYPANSRPNYWNLGPNQSSKRGSPHEQSITFRIVGWAGIGWAMYCLMAAHPVIQVQDH